MKLPFDFTCGGFKLRLDYTVDRFNLPTASKWVWFWNGYYWQLLFPVEQAETDEESLKHVAAFHLV